jgi:hypothetical protein
VCPQKSTLYSNYPIVIRVLFFIHPPVSAVHVLYAWFNCSFSRRRTRHLDAQWKLRKDHLHYRLNFDLNKSRHKFHHSLKEHHKISNAKWLKNGKLRKVILSAFYNISQRNFGILLVLWCSFKLWWKFCLDLFRSKFSL